MDADAYNPAEIKNMLRMGIAVLPVSEIENLLLLPNVIEAILRTEGFAGKTLKAKTEKILGELFTQATDTKNQLPVVMRYCRRRIDRVLKRLDFGKASNIADLSADYSTQTSAVDILALAELASSNIQTSAVARNAAELLKWYDNKGLMAIACKAKGTSVSQFEQWMLRALRNDTAPLLLKAIKKELPAIVAA